MFYEMIKIAFRSIYGQKMRSILVALGVAIGVIAVAGMTTVALSLQSEIKNQLSRFGSDTFMIMRISPIRFMQFGTKRRQMRNIWRRPKLEINYLKQLIEGCPSSEAIAPIASYEGKNVTFGKIKHDVSVSGATSEFNGLTDLKLGYGRFINENDVEHKRYVCVIGETVIEELFSGGNPIGRKLKIDGIPFVVVGILEPFGEAMGHDRDNTIIVPITTALHHWRGWWGVQYMFKALPGKLDRAIDEATAVLRRLRKLKGFEEDDFDIFTSDLMLSFLTVIIGSIYAVGVGIALMSLIVAGIGIMNVMFVSVAERTKEIGIRKACGAAPKKILTQFTVEAAVLSLFGGSLGLITLYIVILAVGNLIPFSISLKLPVLAFGLVFSAVAGVAFGFFPARKAAKLPPVDALRWE